MLGDTEFIEEGAKPDGRRDKHVPAHLREYAAACETFLENKTPAEIERMKALGLLHAERKNGKPTGKWLLADLGLQPAKDTCEKDDAATIFGDSTKLSEWDDVAQQVDKTPELLVERFGLSYAQAKAIAQWHDEIVKAEVERETSLQLLRVIGFFMLPGNLLIRAHALAHAARMAASSGFTSLRDSSRAIGASVEAIRKVAWKWVELLKLPPLEGAKTPAAREAYRATAKEKHWRTKKCTPENLSAALPTKLLKQ